MALVQYIKDRIRVAVDVTKKGQPLVDLITSASMKFWRGEAVQFEFAFFYGDNLIDVTGWSSITLDVRDSVTRSGLDFMSASIGAAQFNPALTVEQWEAGQAAHVIIPFSGSLTALDLGNAVQKDFWLALSATVSGSAEPITLAGGTLTVIEDGANPLDVSIPALGASLIPLGATYDGSGHYTLPVTVNKNHSYTKGANDTSVTNGTQTLATNGNFAAQGGTVTLNGTPSALITATLRYPLYWTADESDARYLTGVAKIMNDKGALIGTRSPSGQFIRLTGIDDSGNFIDQKQDILNP